MWVTAIMLGIASGLHCIGMCSPLMMAVTNMTKSAFVNRLFYNTGRIFSYGILGMLVAGAGSLLPINQYQNIVSLVLGLGLMLIALLQLNVTRVNYLAGITTPVTQFLKQRFSTLLQRKSYVSVMLLGGVNGLLPCGMTTIAMVNCLVLAGPVDGFNFMVLFGVGTLPAMLGFASLLMGLIKKFQLSFQKVTVGMVGLSGMMLIVRVFMHAGVEAQATGKAFVEVVLCR